MTALATGTLDCVNEKMTSPDVPAVIEASLAAWELLVKRVDIWSTFSTTLRRQTVLKAIDVLPGGTDSRLAMSKPSPTRRAGTAAPDRDHRYEPW